MTKALTFVEMDLPRCANTYGVSPCRARLMSDDYAQVGVRFDGSADYFNLATDLSGNADGKKGTASFWIRMNGGNGSNQYIFINSASSFFIIRNSSNKISILGLDGSSNVVLSFVTTTSFVSGDPWRHVLLSWDLSVGRVQCYVDDVVDAGTSVIATNTNIDYTRVGWGFGGYLSGSLLNADVGDFWFGNSSSFGVDISVEATRRKFIDSEKRPVDLGSAGATPTGVSPIVFFSGDLPTWQTNKGTGGGFTLTGALTASAGGSGPFKCFDTRATCQDVDNYVDGTPVTMRFAKPSSYLSEGYGAIPSLMDVSTTPAVVSLGRDLGQRSSVSVTFKDHKDDDRSFDFDPYVDDRTYDPYQRGTFWGKFRSRYLYVTTAAFRVINGYVGQSLADMETRHYLIDSYDSSAAAKYSIRATDVLKLSDDAVAPAPSPGFLTADITATAQELTVSPSGAGASYSSGHLNIAGNELVRYWKSGDEAENVLLLHGEGTNGGTTITDSSSYGHTPSAVGGNAATTTSQFKFGSASLGFDGAGDFIRYNGQSEFAFGTGDFTIDFWFRLSSTGSNRVLIDFRPTGSTGAYPVIYVTSGNGIVYNANAADRITSSGGILSANTWYHVALVRKNAQTRLYLNGASVSASAYADTTNYLVGAGRPVLGISGQDLSSLPYSGHMDEVRMTKGFARWSPDDGAVNFTPPTGAAPVTSDLIYVPYRGQLNTTAAAHNAQDRVQHVLEFVAKDPADILYSLASYLPSFDLSWINLTEWRTETSTYNGNVYTAYVCEPTAVKTLMEEILLQAYMSTWWDEINQKLRLQVLHAVSSSAFEYTPDNYLRDDVSIKEQLDKRLSQILVYFGQKNPLLPLSNKDNYQALSSDEDPDAITNWGKHAVLIVTSRWIPQSGRTVADRLVAILLGRYKTPPRAVSFSVMKNLGIDPLIGIGYRMFHKIVQDATGDSSGEYIPFQATQIKSDSTKTMLSGEEIIFDVPATDLAVRTVTIEAARMNVNLRTEHDTIYPAPTGTETVNFVVAAAALVGSTSTLLPAINVGTWPSGTVLTLTVEVGATVQGKGGVGGDTSFGAGVAGTAGGTAIYTRKAVTITNNGDIWAGGGGGGGAGGQIFVPNGAGGGGAGTQAGAGGGAPLGGTPGSPGTQSAGGSGSTGPGGNGGAGGGPGLAGQNGDPGALGAGAGGAAGAAVDGTSYVTYAVPGDIRGSLVN